MVRAPARGQQLDLSDIQLFLFDLDGVLFLGKDEPELIGGSKLLPELRDRGTSFSILTNNTTDSRDQIRKKLASIGLEVTVEEILSASYLTAKYLFNRFSKTSCYLLGEEGFARELKAYGHTLVDDDADSVVVGIDRNLTYDKLDKAVQQLRGGARLIAGHKARLYMDAGGPKLGPGAIVKGLEYASGKRATSVGKPLAIMFKIPLEEHRCTADKALMVGDQVETDIIGASKLGINTVLVLSGLEDRESAQRSSVKPDLVLENVDDLLEHL